METVSQSLASDVEEYEAWLRTQCDVSEKGLDRKHEKMAESAFRFYRAACFRFARTVPIFVPELCDAPETVCVGDPHIENRGTWRDGEGRLVWGVNDFDDAAPLPKAGAAPSRHQERVREGTRRPQGG